MYIYVIILIKYSPFSPHSILPLYSALLIPSAFFLSPSSNSLMTTPTLPCASMNFLTHLSTQTCSPISRSGVEDERQEEWQEEERREKREV